MQRTPLYVYLEKVAQGEQGYTQKLCQQLADRLLYVPILSAPAGAAGTLKVQVVRVDENEVKRVPAFTTEKLYKSWSTTFTEKTKFISLLGGDFCAALKSDTSVVIDPGTVHSVVLDPATAHQVAISSPDDQGEAGGLPAPDETKIPENLRGRSEPTSYLQRPKPGVAIGESAPGGGSGFFGGAFAAGLDIKQDTPIGSEPSVSDTMTQPIAPLNKPVIFSPDSDSNRVVREKEDPTKKKRRSFLKFLKGS